MKTKGVFLAIIIMLSITESVLAQPNWSSIKSLTTPSVSIPAEFGTPYLQPLAVGGWEDGIFITRDGLNLYCFYTPVDLLSWQFIGGANNANFSPYSRGPQFGMDLTTPPFVGPTEWLQSDILISQRTNTSTPFPTWQLSNLARSVWGEGAPQINSNTATTADLFAIVAQTTYSPYSNDILLYYGSSLNPSFSLSPLPANVNTTAKEDNPHIERLSPNDLVLFFDSDDRPGGVGQLDLWYTTSPDNGMTWTNPQQVSSINTANGEQQPHLFNNGTDWYLYFTGTNTVSGKTEIYRAKQNFSGNWNSWTNIESVVGVGNAFAVGEPSLTQNGDLSFVVIYSDTVNGTSTDKYDADPWILPKLSTVSVAENLDVMSSFAFYPNPANTELTLSIYPNDKCEISISNLHGQLLIKKQNQNHIDISSLTNGIYIMTITQGQNKYTQKFIKE